jgi:hypothetical protein
MFRAQTFAFVGFVGFILTIAAGSAAARQLHLVIDSDFGWDTNVFQRVSNTESDGYWEFSPRITVRESSDTLVYNFSYRPTYQAFFEIDDIDGWDHYGRATVDWLPTPVDTFSFNGSIVSSRHVRQFSDQDESLPFSDPDRFLLVESDRKRVVRSVLRLGYGRSLSPVTTARVDLHVEDIDFEDDQNIDVRSFALSMGSTRVVNRRFRMGLSATGRIREGRGVDSIQPLGQFSSHTLSGDLSAFLSVALTKSIRLSVRAGPSLTQTEQNAPPFRDADPNTSVRDRTDADNSTSFIADVGLTKRWAHSTASLGYTRFESVSGGTSSAAFVDQFSFSLNHQPTREWNMNLKLSWLQRETISPIGSLGNLKFNRYSASASAAYVISRQFSVIGRGSFRRFGNQARLSNIPKVTTSEFTELFVGMLTLRYTFNPISI